MNLENLDTPALTVDLDVVDANLQRMASYARDHKLQLRPHAKTHKIPELARKQLSHGAQGITVAKVGEAEVMVKSGIQKILLAYPAYGPQKWSRFAALAREAELTISLDSLPVAQGLAAALQRVHAEAGVLVEIDVGLHRCGVHPTQAIELAQQISRLPALRLQGLMFYPGHIKNPERQSRQFRELQDTVASLCESFQKVGLPLSTVSGGSTPTAFSSHKIEGLTEIRPGTYIFNDANEVNAGVASLQMCAARVLARVVSTSVPNQMIVDAGSKTLSSARSWVAEDPFLGWIWEDTGARLRALNEEHGYVDLSATTRKYRVGDLVQILPNHICECVNLQERLYGIRRGQVEAVWEVEARGKIT